jgi:hypothetical protein
MKKQLTIKRLIIIGGILAVSHYIIFQIIIGHMTLENDEKIIGLIKNRQEITDYAQIDLGDIKNGAEKRYYYKELGMENDALSLKPLRYSFYIRSFLAWRFLKDEVPLNENWVLWGYVTSDGEVFVIASQRGDAVIL